MTVNEEEDERQHLSMSETTRYITFFQNKIGLFDGNNVSDWDEIVEAFEEYCITKKMDGYDAATMGSLLLRTEILISLEGQQII